jgi:hypothetical protein
MKNPEIEYIIKVLEQAEEELLDLPIEWQEEAAEADIDTLHAANVLAEAAEFLQTKVRLFHVTLWETREVVKSVANLNYAKKWARGRGHTGEDDPCLTGYPPIAYVADDNGDIIYNPRFSKKLKAEVSGLINAQPSNHF